MAACLLGSFSYHVRAAPTGSHPSSSSSNHLSLTHAGIGECSGHDLPLYAQNFWPYPGYGDFQQSANYGYVYGDGQARSNIQHQAAYQLPTWLGFQNEMPHSLSPHHTHPLHNNAEQQMLPNPSSQLPYFDEQEPMSSTQAQSDTMADLTANLDNAQLSEQAPVEIREDQCWGRPFAIPEEAEAHRRKHAAAWYTHYIDALQLEHGDKDKKTAPSELRRRKAAALRAAQLKLSLGGTAAQPEESLKRTRGRPKVFTNDQKRGRIKAQVARGGRKYYKKIQAMAKEWNIRNKNIYAAISHFHQAKVKNPPIFMIRQQAQKLQDLDDEAKRKRVIAKKQPKPQRMNAGRSLVQMDVASSSHEAVLARDEDQLSQDVSSDAGGGGEEMLIEDYDEGPTSPSSMGDQDHDIPPGSGSYQSSGPWLSIGFNHLPNP